MLGSLGKNVRYQSPLGGDFPSQNHRIGRNIFSSSLPVVVMYFNFTTPSDHIIIVTLIHLLSPI